MIIRACLDVRELLSIGKPFYYKKKVNACIENEKVIFKAVNNVLEESKPLFLIFLSLKKRQQKVSICSFKRRSK